MIDCSKPARVGSLQICPCGGERAGAATARAETRLWTVPGLVCEPMGLLDRENLGSYYSRRAVAGIVVVSSLLARRPLRELAQRLALFTWPDPGME